ncbi:MAG TPA: hypothetical protein VMF61_02390 [Candidatus Acidoferrales bacterium]|nr:hypothetical protein [Candidatus Acidoferrales bacterium]
MKLTMMVCDMAQVADGKLYILGGGWHVTTAPTGPCAVALLVDVEWEDANKKHEFVIELVDADGQPISMPGPTGEFAPLRIGGAFETGRPPGARPGSVTSVPLAVNFGPLPLEADRLFQWRATIDADLALTATWPFATRNGSG